MSISIHNYSELITKGNLLQAWLEFKKDKKKKGDILVFERHLEDNLATLLWDLENKRYEHGSYLAFYVNDPKRRHIHKAPVRDRVIHHLLYTYLYPVFDNTFIFDSYSCRLDKGTHKGVKRLEQFIRKASHNYTRPCFTLQCDIQKFFANVNHKILFKILSRRVIDKDILKLLSEVIESFHVSPNTHKGIPLGNLTSQVFANIYLNELDQFMKHELKIKYYIRYADDFIIVSEKRENLANLVDKIKEFLSEDLDLSLHPNKIIFRNIYFGVDFLGYILFPHHILPRTKTTRRLFKKIHKKIELYKDNQITDKTLSQTVASYLGYLSHANSYKLSKRLKNEVWFWSDA